MNTNVLPQLRRVSPPHEQRSRILIIDDEDDQLLALSTRLQKQGYETLTANTGSEGLAKARESTPHLILLDVGLPDMSGLDVCAQIVDAVETCGVPVVIISAADSPDIVRRCRAAGSEYFIRKPYDPNVLLTMVERALEGAW